MGALQWARGHACLHHQVTTRLADALAEKSHVILWSEMPEGVDETLYCRGRKLAALVKDG